MWSPRAKALTLVPIALIGVLGSIPATRWGIGLDADSAIYLNAAQNLLNGQGLVNAWPDGPSPLAVPLTHFPPLYPMLLAALRLTGVDMLDATRWLQIGLLGVDIFLVGLLTYECAASLLAAVVCALLASVSVVMLQVDLRVYSEGVFIALSLTGFLALARHIDRHTRGSLWLASLLFGLALMTRYAGVALIATAVLAILGLSQKRSSSRVADVLLLVLVSSIPIVAWIARNVQVAGGADPGRILSFHPLDLAHLRTAIVTIAAWIVPLTDPSIAGAMPDLPHLRAGVIVAELVMAVLLVSRVVWHTRLAQTGGRGLASGAARTWRELPTISHILIIFVAAYTALLVFNITFFDAETPLDARILSPAYVALLPLSCAWWRKAWVDWTGSTRPS